MTKKETAQILSIIDSVYPNFKVKNIDDTLNAWYFVLGDHDYKQITEALKIYINTSQSGFAPSVSELIGMTHKTAALTQMTELEAWTLVRKAISRSTYYAQEEYDKLPETVQKAVGSPEQLRNWASSSIDSIETVVASNFQRTYRAMVKRQEQIEMLPADTRARLDSLQRLALEGVKNG